MLVLMVLSMNSPYLFHGESDIEGPSCKVSKGCRLEEKLGDSNIEHRVVVFWQRKRNWWEGGVAEVVQGVEYALWENRENSTEKVDLLIQNQTNTRNSVGVKTQQGLLIPWPVTMVWQLWWVLERMWTCLSTLGCNLLSEGRCILPGHTALHSSWGACREMPNPWPSNSVAVEPLGWHRKPQKDPARLSMG